MKKIFSFFLFLFGCYTLVAQYTDIINSNRPGLSESPFAVGTNVLQFESGLFYISNEDESLVAHPTVFGANAVLRFGQFFEKLEIDAHIKYQNNEVKNPFGSNYNNFGLKEVTLGAKYMFYKPEYKDKSKEIRSWKAKMAFDKKRLIPAVGLYAGVNTNFVSEVFKDDGISFKAKILLQNDFSDRLILVTNVIADYITSEKEYYGYAVGLTYSISHNFSIFGEQQGFFKKETSPDFNFGGGAAYLISNNLQIDAAINTKFFKNYNYLYSTVGISYRIDNHKDKIISTQNPYDVLNKKPKKRRKSGNFFSRLFKKNK